VDFGQDEEISATKIMEHGQNTIAILSLLIVYPVQAWGADHLIFPFNFRADVSRSD